jgi:hypothetical protein
MVCAKGMPSKKPGNSVRLWVSNEDLERLKAISERTELTQVEIMTRILHAGVEAIYRQDFLTLPLRFASLDGTAKAAQSVQTAKNVIKR